MSYGNKNQGDEEDSIDERRRGILKASATGVVGYPFFSEPVAAELLTSADVALVQEQSLAVEWMKTYGGTNDDIANAVIQTNDGGYAFAGSTTRSATNSSDFWLVKTDPNGDIEFERVLGGDENDRAQTLIQTDDGGFAVGGTVHPERATVLRTDSQGDTVFNKSYAPHGHIGAIVQTDDGGFAVDTGIVIGFGNEAFLKLDSDGNVVIENDNYFSSRVARLNALVQTDDGGFALAGHLDLFSDADALFVKLDSDGQLDFFKEYVTPGADRAWSMVKTEDGGFAMVGDEGHRGEVESRSWFRKLDSQANVEFKKTFDDSDDGEAAKSVVQTNDGGFAIVGFSGDGSSRDAWFRKLDSEGNLETEFFFGGDEFDEARSIAQTADGGFIIAGRTQSSGAGEDDAWLIKTEPLQSPELTEFIRLRNEKLELAERLDDVSVGDLGELGRITHTLDSSDNNSDLTDLVQAGDITPELANRLLDRLLKAEGVTDETLGVIGESSNQTTIEDYQLAFDTAGIAVGIAFDLLYSLLVLDPVADHFAREGSRLRDIIDAGLDFGTAAVEELFDWLVSLSGNEPLPEDDIQAEAKDIVSRALDGTLETSSDIANELKNVNETFTDIVGEIIQRSVETGSSATLHVHSDGDFHHHPQGSSIDLKEGLRVLDEQLDPSKVASDGLSGDASGVADVINESIEELLNAANLTTTFIEDVEEKESALDIAENTFELVESIRDGRWSDAFIDALAVIGSLIHGLATLVTSLIQGIAGWLAFITLRKNHTEMIEGVIIGDQV